MRVAIVACNGHLDQQLKRTLSAHGINGDIVTSITKRVMNDYGCIVLSSHNEIPNLPILVEQLVLQQTTHVVFISRTPSIGQFYNVLNDMFFHIIQEWVMDVELPLLIQTIQKFHKPYQQLQQKHDDIQEQLDTMKLTTKAKNILMKRGYSEEEAHQFIQKKAMDMRVSKKHLVNLIIKNKIDI